VRQRQWLLRPDVSFALSSRSDISLGPLIQYNQTDSVPGRFISDTRPYGFGRFGQIGLRLNVHLSAHAGFPEPIVREGRRTILPPPLHRFEINVDGVHFPALWDVTDPFQYISGRAGASVTLPVPTHTVLVTRVGGKVLFGPYPFHESAFLGGIGAARSVGFQSFEGDASLYASAELRARMAKFVFVLPLDAGPVLLGDASRVYAGGAPSIRWNTAFGAGVWLGLRDSPVLMTITALSQDGRVRFTTRSGLRF
jgi:hypothetical protein